VSRPVRVVPASSAAVPELTAALAAALDGSGPAVLPVEAPDAHGPGHARDAAGEVPDDVALLVRTSGSTGAPREVMLTAAALRASGAATEARLAGPGRWLLPLPPAHVAGLQVLVRSILAGTEPAVLAGPFRADAFAVAAARLAGDDDAPRYTSLVPTQVHRLLDSGPGREALASFDAVLLGGAAAPPGLLDAARSAGARVVTTYGMSETCGGCVYDGVPLDGVTVDLDPADGRVRIAGPVLAAGYRGRPDLDAELFEVQDGTRWLCTSDLGRWHDDGRLEVLGRADDVLVTGGVKVPPAAVERALAGLPGVGEVLVVGVPDPEWGQALVAVVVPAPGAPAPDLADLREAAAAALGGPAAPRHLVTLAALPLRGPGKPDRRGAAELAARELGLPAPDAATPGT